MNDEKMYEIMRKVEKILDERDLPKNMVNTVIILNELGYLNCCEPSH